jgi:hypothetical protein
LIDVRGLEPAPRQPLEWGIARCPEEVPHGVHRRRRRAPRVARGVGEEAIDDCRPRRAPRPMTDHTAQWQQITGHRMRGRKWLLLHLLLYPALVYLIGFALARMRGEDPVVFYAVAVLVWFVGFAWLVHHYEAYDCPGCGARVRFSSARMPVTNVRPCPGCGLARPVI